MKMHSNLLDISENVPIWRGAADLRLAAEANLLAPKELYTWYYPMTINPLFEHTPVLNDNFEYWCRDDFVDCDFYED